MTLFLDEKTVGDLLSVDDAIEAVSTAFEARGRGRIVNMPRQRLRHDGGTVRVTAAIAEDEGYFGFKVSSSAVFGSNSGRVLSLYELSTGRLCAICQVFGMGALRTGAVSSVATDLMARPDSEALGLIGTGRQARAQLDAIVAVRPIKRVRVFGRDRARCDDFVSFARESGLQAARAASARDAVEGVDIVVTATSAVQPVLFGDWLEGGVHINAIGANDESRRELDSQVVAMSDIVVTDEPRQARYEASDLIAPVSEGLLSWEEVRGVDEVICGLVDGRRSHDDVTLFKSLGTATADVVLAARAYERALEVGVGVRLPEISGDIS